MIEHGLTDCSQYRPRNSLSEDDDQPPSDHYVSLPGENTNLGMVDEGQKSSGNKEMGIQKALSQTDDHLSETQAPSDMGPFLKPPSRTSPESSESDWETLDSAVVEDANSKGGEHERSGRSEILPKESSASESIPITVQPQANTGHTVFVPGLISGLEEDQYGMPLAIFTKVMTVHKKGLIFGQGML